MVKATRTGTITPVPRNFLYSVTLPIWRRFIRRMAFFFSTRRSSLLEMNQRFLRTVLNTPLLTTFFLNRLSSWSCDSFWRNTTVGTPYHLLPSSNIFVLPETIKNSAGQHTAAEWALWNIFSLSQMIIR